MANITVSGDLIRMIQQTVEIDGGRVADAWCTNISSSAGLGATSADIEFPFRYADELGDRYADRKVVVRAGFSGGTRTAFVGYLSGKSEDISATTDSVKMTAYTVGHYIAGIGVGEDLGHWHYKYPLFDKETGALTGRTPASVLRDLFARLPEKWQSEIALGNVAVLTGAYDLPVQSYDFSLSTYEDAIKAIEASMGDVAVRERFGGDKCYLDFFRISDPSAPENFVKVSERDDGDDANVASIQPTVTSDEVRNCAIAFGTDREFMVTCRSVVTGMPEVSEPVNPATGLYDTALVKDWDPEIEHIVLQDPLFVQDDTVKRSVKVVGETDPGTGGTTFPVETNVALVANKCILINGGGEGMLVTAFTPGSPGSVTVTRLYQAWAGATAHDMKVGENLTLVVPGISKCFRDYRLPPAFLAWPDKEILGDLPVLDAATGGRLPAQIFSYPSAGLRADMTNQEKLIAAWLSKPHLESGAEQEFDKLRIRLQYPAIRATTVEMVDGKRVSTYVETVVGVTFSYIDHLYPFGWTTGTVKSDLGLPWETQTERVKLDDFVYQQATNTGYPLVYGANSLTFGVVFIDPDSHEASESAAVLRNDIAYLQTAANRLLSEKNRRHVAYSATIPWADFGYQIGNRLRVRGLDKQPADLLSITQVSWRMDKDGRSGTSLTVDNVKPPERRSFKGEAR